MELAADTLILGAVWFVVFLFSTTLHEAAHAFVAHRLGDPTAYHGGQVTLNPAPHVRREPMGMVIVPLVSFAIGGWMFGWASAPYDPRWADRHPKRAGFMGLAGPVSNLGLAVMAGVAIRIGVAGGWLTAPDRVGMSSLAAATGGGMTEGIATLVSVLFMLNLILFVFNLLPFPPLDGSSVLQLLLPDDLARRWRNLVSQPMLSLVGILIAWQLFDRVFSPVLLLALRLLYPEVTYG